MVIIFGHQAAPFSDQLIAKCRARIGRIARNGRVDPLHLFQHAHGFKGILVRFARNADHNIRPEPGGAFALGFQLIADAIGEVNGVIIIFFGTFLVEQAQHAVAARFKTNRDNPPVSLFDQRFIEIRPLSHRIGAPSGPIAPALGFAWILFNPLAQPFGVLEKHRIVDHHRADTIFAIQVV